MIQDTFTKYAEDGTCPEMLAQLFLKEYFGNNEPTYPLNPFCILKDLGILFDLRLFNGLDGLYIPSSDKNDKPLIGINLNNRITRQRYTAAHELCHYLKDSKKSCVCEPHSQSSIERYAESFAAALLMPKKIFTQEVAKRCVDNFICNDDVLLIAEKFGVSFESCLNRIRYDLKLAKTDSSNAYLPDTKRKEKGFSHVVLYRQLFDAIGNQFDVRSTEYSLSRFKNELIYNDSRLEGINISDDKVAEIVTDLRDFKQKSKFCNEENEKIIEVAGLTFVYDYIFNNFENDVDIYIIKKLHKLLYNTAPHPEYAGSYKTADKLVIGSKFESDSYTIIAKKIMDLDEYLTSLLNEADSLSNSEYIEKSINIHYKLTVIHPFKDGNGRISRAIVNLLLLRRKLPLVFFDKKAKDTYKDNLAVVDATGNFNELYVSFYKSLLQTNTILTDYNFKELAV